MTTPKVLSANPLLAPSSYPFGAVDFSRIKTEDFGPAIHEALQLARTRLKAIEVSTELPTFANTIEALEFCGEELELVAGVFQNFLGANTNESLQKLAQEVMPLVAAFSNDVFLSAPLFARVKAVYEQGMPQDPEQKELLSKTYKQFVRNGALLDDVGKARLREVDGRLAVASQQFSDHVLKATNAYEYVITDPAELAGLPEFAKETCAEIAKERGKVGSWVVTLDAPVLIPFLRFADKRDLRERLWRAYNTRATTGETDNRELLREIVTLRHERATLLGFRSHAEFVLQMRMAESPAKVRSFLDGMLLKVKPAAERELKDLERFAGHSLKPWDTAYYSERLKKDRFRFDEQALRPYFRLESVIKGVFEVASKLYGLSFVERKDIPVYHSDVQVFEVNRGSEFIGLLYTDFYPRPSKRGGAWMTGFKDQGTWNGNVERPHVLIVCNVTKPTATRPSLLAMDEVRTIFHEFGHALHGLLSRCRYRSLGGANVYWDFVELPSQIMENWVKEKEALDLFAHHYETGEAIPTEWVDRLRELGRFQSGMFALRQLNFGRLDMAYHDSTFWRDGLLDLGDIETFERAVTKETMILPLEAGVLQSATFSHVFAGGYSAGYYSYKWAEVLEADAFEFFKEKGIFNSEVAERFRTAILERGGTEHPAELYARFRGRGPDQEALLRRDGLAGIEI